MSLKIIIGLLIQRDEIKKEFCINNKIDLINIKYNENIEEKLNFLSE